MNGQQMLDALQSARRSLRGSGSGDPVGDVASALHEVIDVVAALAAGRERAGARVAHGCQDCTDTQPCERARRLLSGGAS